MTYMIQTVPIETKNLTELQFIKTCQSKFELNIKPETITLDKKRNQELALLDNLKFQLRDSSKKLEWEYLVPNMCDETREILKYIKEFTDLKPDFKYPFTFVDFYYAYKFYQACMVCFKKEKESPLLVATKVNNKSSRYFTPKHLTYSDAIKNPFIKKSFKKSKEDIIEAYLNSINKF